MNENRRVQGREAKESRRKKSFFVVGPEKLIMPQSTHGVLLGGEEAEPRGAPIQRGEEKRENINTVFFFEETCPEGKRTRRRIPLASSNGGKAACEPAH